VQRQFMSQIISLPPIGRQLTGRALRMLLSQGFQHIHGNYKYLFMERWRIIDMIITAKLNNDDSKVYYLVSWNSQDFANTMTIKVQGNDL